MIERTRHTRGGVRRFVLVRPRATIEAARRLLDVDNERPWSSVFRKAIALQAKFPRSSVVLVM